MTVCVYDIVKLLDLIWPESALSTVQDLVSLLYSSLLEEGRGDEFASDLRAFVGGSGLTWFSKDRYDDDKSFLGYVGNEFSVENYMNYYFEIDDWHKYVAKQAPGKIITLDENYNHHHFGRGEFFNDFCLPQIKAASILCANVDPASNSHLSIYRDAGDRPFSAEDIAVWETLLPHLSNWRAIYARFDEMQASLARLQGALDGVDFGVAVVDGQRRLLNCNIWFERLLSNGVYLSSQNGRLNCSAAAADALNAIIVAAASASVGDSLSHGGAVRLQGDLELPSLVVRAVPWVSDAGRFTRGGHALLIVSALNRNRPPRADLLKEVFGLSDAEASVADFLARGFSTNEIAQTRGARLRTVQNQIKTILSKSGCAKQTNFIALASSLYF